MTETVRRAHTRIIFGEGQERWSVLDPEQVDEKLEAEFHAATERAHFHIRDLASTYLYLISACPTTELACEKLRAIRRALRTVEIEPRKPASQSSDPPGSGQHRREGKRE